MCFESFFPHQLNLSHFSEKKFHGCCLIQCLNCLVMNKEGPEGLDKSLSCSWTGTQRSV